MADPLRVAAVGLVHDHIWGTLDHLRQDGRATIVAASVSARRLRGSMSRTDRQTAAARS